MLLFTTFIVIVLYFILHSLLCSFWFKARVQQAFPRYFNYYRLFFNVFSGVLILPIFILHLADKSQPLWQWIGWQQWIANIIALVSILAFYRSLKDYDMDEFVGIKQIKHTSEVVVTNFSIGYFHRYVRHPWYFFLLIMIWTREMNHSLFLICILSTLYLIIGSRLEENKLLKLYGERYKKYRMMVPGLIPLPWRFLTQEQAIKILSSKNNLSIK